MAGGAKELSIYIHIPFCVQKCLYCDFLSAPAPEGLRERYVERLGREITEESGKYSAYVVKSVFWAAEPHLCFRLGRLEKSWAVSVITMR